MSDDDMQCANKGTGTGHMAVPYQPDDDDVARLSLEDEPAKHWIPCRIITDVVGFGVMSLGSEFKLDDVFDEWFEQVPSLTAARDPRKG
jgi:hypothetical protein